MNIIFLMAPTEEGTGGLERGGVNHGAGHGLTLESSPLLASPPPKAYAYLGQHGLGYQASMRSSQPPLLGSEHWPREPGMLGQMN